MEKKKTSMIGRWFSRWFRGGNAELESNAELYASPARLAVKRFFRRPSATIALILLVAMFLFVFIAPLLNPIDLSYSETLHKNLSPSFDMMSAPAALAKNLKEISSYSIFSIGCDNEGKVYTWGKTYLKTIKTDIADLPDEVKNSKIIHVAAGADHAVAVSEDGHVYCWGEYDNGQYGLDGTMILNAIPEPDELLDGVIDAANVKQVAAGNQVSAIVMNDGTSYMWGNYNIGAINMESFEDVDNLDQVVFLQSVILGLDKDGRLVTGKTAMFDTFELRKPGETAKLVSLWDYIGDRKVVDLASNLNNACILLEDGECIVIGSSDDAAYYVPVLPEGDRIKSLDGGAKHYTLLSEQGRVYAWGGNTLHQLEVPDGLDGKNVDEIITEAFQNYAVKDGRIVDRWGFRGYLMGTDELGRDVFNRVINGGKMTMTIGAVAVIIEAIIGIIVGCIAGYFGGWVDLLLMRVAEIFSAIPFLPFAVVLSAVFRQTNVKEDTRIFVIMVILGVLSWPGLAQLIRGQVLAEREKEFVLAAQSMGVKESRIAFKHILPNVISVIIVSMTLSFASCMLTEASLSYLGFGVQLPRPTWGNMLYGCNSSLVIKSFWWRWLFPAIFLSVTTICINVIGDNLRDVLDPKSEVDK